MRYQDLDLSTQILLVAMLSMLLAAMLLRGSVFLYRKFAQIAHVYPNTWTAAQRKLLERFRAAVGLTLASLWILLLMATPKMPTNWPFGFLEGLSILTLLLLTNGWMLLILPRDWEQLGGLTKRFSVMIAALVLWWSVMLGITAWMLVKATSPKLPQFLPGPVVAVIPIEMIQISSD